MGKKKMKVENNRKLYACICQYCGGEFWVPRNKITERKYCSKSCYNKSMVKRIDVNCAYCGKMKSVTPSEIKNVKHGKHFCNRKCYWEYKKMQNIENRKCEICGKIYETKKSSKQRFCSIQCQGKWQSVALTGENAVGYNKNFSINDRTIECEWCGEKYVVTPARIKKSRFCSKECSDAWFREVVVHTRKHKERMRVVALKNLADGVFNKTQTKPQVRINNLLDSINVNYENEKTVGYYSIDNFLTDSNLAIEVMGTYWHCDIRFYPKIKYEKQVMNIRTDKARDSYLRKKRGLHILYLWEYDIMNNENICREIILYFIHNKGKLSNYHSLNYNYTSKDGLNINSDIIIPYMYWDKHDLDTIINIKPLTEITCKKDPTKWIKFNCDYCGMEKEVKKHVYDKSEKHYCSNYCKGKDMQKRISVKCPNCGKTFWITPSKHGRGKTKLFFCCRGCQKEYYRGQYSFVIDSDGKVSYNCEYCGKLCRKAFTDYSKSDHHFCGNDCYNAYRRKK